MFYYLQCTPHCILNHFLHQLIHSHYYHYLHFLHIFHIILISYIISTCNFHICTISTLTSSSTMFFLTFNFYIFFFYIQLCMNMFTLYLKNPSGLVSSRVYHQIPNQLNTYLCHLSAISDIQEEEALKTILPNFFYSTASYPVTVQCSECW